MKRKILIVDDSTNLTLIVSSIAKNLNYECHVETDGRQCVKRVREIRPDVILMDINLPDVSGLKLIRDIKNQHELSSIPVIVFSGYSNAQLKQDAYNLGAAAYIVKDCELERLFEVIGDQFQDSIGVRELSSVLNSQVAFQ